MTQTAVIIGVGPAEGLGAYLSVKAAEEGLQVIVSGRTQKDLDAVVEIVCSFGGKATAIVADATNLSSVNTLIKKAEAIGPIDLAREFQPQGIHLGHIVIDGGIMGDKVVKAHPRFAAKAGKDGLIGLTGIAEAYLYLYRQPRNAWTFELDLRTRKENF